MAVLLIEYTKDIIERGTLVRCKGQYPYEDVVDFLVCESQHENCYQLVVASGYKAGLTFCYLPEESVPEGMRFGCSTKWLIQNWTKWGYADCPLESVRLIENPAPACSECCDKYARFVVVTQDQNSKEKAKKLAERIKRELNITAQPDIQQYDKFEKSYRIEFTFPFNHPEKSIEESIRKTRLICSPWIVEFNNFTEEIELMFNRTEGSEYGKPDMNVIVWAGWRTHKLNIF